MTDSEIETLRLAAKAAGISHTGYTTGRGLYAGGWWNPLQDSGQALELAVKLRIDILLDPPTGDVPCVEARANHGDEVDPFAIEALGKGDDNAAVRLAITRAAAAMAQGEQT